MVLPQTFTNVVPNPSPMPNGLGVETRRNLIVNPAMYPTTGSTQIRVNDAKNPSFENVNPGTGDWATAQNVFVGTVTTTGVVSGSRALIMQPNGASSTSILDSITPRTAPQIANGTTVEVSATITIPAAQAGTLDSNARRFALFTKNSSTAYNIVLSPQAPNAPGTYRLTAQITIATGTGVEFWIRLFNGSNLSTDIVYWDAVMIQDVSTISNASNTYFDGSTPSTDTIDGTFINGWTGVTHNSTSRQSVYAINGYSALVGSWSRWTKVNTYAGGGCASVGFNTGSAPMATGQTEDITLPAATQYTFSAYVFRPTGAPAMKLRAMGPGMTTVDSTAATTLTNSWERLSVTFTTVTAGTYSLSLRNSVSTTAASISVLTDAWQLETGAVATSFFNGDSAAANLSYQWLGTPNNSISTETGLAMPNFTGLNANLTAATVSSAQRLGITPSSASTQSKAYIGPAGPGGLRLGLQPGKTYYMQARLLLSGALTGTADANDVRNMTVYTVKSGVTSAQRTAPSTNAAGTYVQSMVFTVPSDATEAYVSLNNGHPSNGGTAYWDQVMITESRYAQVESWLGDLPDLTQHSASLCSVTNVAVGQLSKLSLTPNNASNASYVSWNGTTSGTNMKAGTMAGHSYNLQYEIQVPVIQTGTLNADARRAVILVTTPSGTTTTKATQVTNTVATTTQNVNFTVPADATAVEIRLYNGAATAGGAVYYNKVKLTDTSLTNFAPNYFDGTTFTAADHRVVRWLGNANASASQFTYRGLWVEANAAVTPPRVQFTVAGLGLSTRYNVAIRRLAGGDTMNVAGWANRGVLDIAVGTDWLVPLNTPTEYQLWVNGSQIDAVTVQFSSPAAWVADPLVPTDAMPIYTVPTGNALQLTKEAMLSKTYTIDKDTVNVIGARYPIVRGGQRQMLQDIDLSVQAPANTTSDQFYELIKDAPVLCIRTHPSWGNMPPVIYVAVDITERPINRQRGGQFTVWEVRGQVVQPVTRGPIIAGVTHAEVQANLAGRTHQSIKNVSTSRRWVDIIADPLSLGV